MKTNSGYLLISCNAGKLGEVMTQMGTLDSIKEIQGTRGAYDIVVKVESATSDLLQRFIMEKIRTLTDVRSALMLHCKPNFK